mgnify:CR=1 FL=1
MNTSGQVPKPPNKAEIGTDTLVTQPKQARVISDLEISEALCQGVKGGKRVAPTELEDTKACRRGLLLLESTRLQYAMKVSLVGVISCSPAPFCCCGGRQSDVREHLQTSFNRGVRALSLARTPMLQLEDTGEGAHAPEHHSLSI